MSETAPGPPSWVLALVALVVGGLAVGGFLLLQAQTGPNAPVAQPPHPQESAADPNGQRLRLAHRFFDLRDHRTALEHYMKVLDRDPRNPEALSHAGWIAFSSGDVDTGERLARSSLEAEPNGPEALWFLAHVRLYGRDDPWSALPPLETLRARTDLSDEFRLEVDRLLQLAHGTT